MKQTYPHKNAFVFCCPSALLCFCETTPKAPTPPIPKERRRKNRVGMSSCTDCLTLIHVWKCVFLFLVGQISNSKCFKTTVYKKINTLNVYDVSLEITILIVTFTDIQTFQHDTFVRILLNTEFMICYLRPN